MVLTSWEREQQEGKDKVKTSKKESDKNTYILNRRCRGSAHRQLSVCSDTPGGCSLPFGRYPEQPMFWEHRAGDRKQGQVTISAQSGGWCLAHGRRGQTCVCTKTVTLTLVCGSAAAPCQDGCLVAAAAQEQGCAQGPFPALSWHSGTSWQYRKSSSCSLLGWLDAQSVFGNNERHCTTFQQKDWEDRWWRVSSAPLKDFCIYFILIFVWRGYAAFQEGKPEIRFPQEAWELKIAMSSWLGAY